MPDCEMTFTFIIRCDSIQAWGKLGPTLLHQSYDWRKSNFGLIKDDVFILQVVIIIINYELVAWMTIDFLIIGSDVFTFWECVGHKLFQFKTHLQIKTTPNLISVWLFMLSVNYLEFWINHFSEEALT